jgi:tetratricopeptide (TPR) repeat protein
MTEDHLFDRLKGECGRFQDLVERRVVEDEAYTEVDNALLHRHEAECAECATFKAMLDSLEDFEAVSAKSADAAIHVALDKRFASQSKPIWTQIAIAASALLALGIGLLAYRASRPNQEDPIQFELAQGRLQIASEEIGSGQWFSFGEAVVVPIEKDALLKTYDALFIAAQTNSKLRLVQATPKSITLKLEAGRMALHLVPSSDVSLEVELPDGVVKVTGTVFIVEADGKKSSVSVVRGSVEVQGRDRQKKSTRKVSEGLAYSFGKRDLAKREKNPSDNLLILLGMPDTAEVAVAEADLAAPKPSAVEDRPDEDAPAPLMEKANTEPPADEKPSLESLIQAAGACRARKDFECAVRHYEDLVRHYPNRPDSTTTLVPMAQILLDNLRRPQAALKYFRRYRQIRPKGGLGQEALWGECNALRALGQAQGEKVCLEKYLERYPGAIFSSTAKSRLNDIFNH